MKLQYNDTVYDINKTDAVEYIKEVFLKTIESRQGKADDPERPQRVAAVLAALADGNVPTRGSKGSTREPWEAERTVILKSLLESAGLDHSLKGAENVESAMAELASFYKTEYDIFAERLNARAKARFELLNEPLNV